MKSKKTVIIGVCIILFCILLIVFFSLLPRIRGYFIKEEAIRGLYGMSAPEYVALNDNRAELEGGEYVEYDTAKCAELVLTVAEALDGSKYKGVKENFLGGFCLIFRAGQGEDEITLWIYEDRIEIARGNYVALCALSAPSLYNKLSELAS